MYNKGMTKMGEQKNQKGFTIVEVMLVLALTGLLFIGLIGGFSGSLARQRYKDSTNDVVSQLRSYYSLVSDTQVQPRSNSSACYGLSLDASGAIGGIDASRYNVNRGRSNCVVYGIAASINGGTIEVTQILGKDIHYVDNSVTTGASDIQLLKELQGNNLVAVTTAGGPASSCSITLAGEHTKYTMKWGSALKKDGTHDDLTATVLIFRSPRNGGIRTYVWEDVVRDAQGDPVDYSALAGQNLSCTSGAGQFRDQGINKYLDNFQEKELRMCVEAGDGMLYDGHRRLVRILQYGHSSSAVELVDADQTIIKDKC